MVYNCDELGLDPTASGGRGFTLGRHSERRYRLKTGEKAPFWITVMLTTIPPLVVHEGGTDNLMPGNFLLNLDPSMVAHCTSSGYMDREGFTLFATCFVRLTGANRDNPKYLFMDGHDSHFDSV